MTEAYRGQCLCGGVVFHVEGPIDHVDACHCKMCQRWSGGPFIGADLRHNNVAFEKDETLRWYDSSDWAQRGFCSECGASMFYRLKNVDDFWAVAIGTLDDPPNTELGKEIFIDEKPPVFAFAGDHSRMTGEEFLATLNLSSDEAK